MWLIQYALISGFVLVKLASHQTTDAAINGLLSSVRDPPGIGSCNIETFKLRGQHLSWTTFGCVCYITCLFIMDAVQRIFLKVVSGMSRSPVKEACAEFFGTFLFVLCGDGVMATITLDRLGHSASTLAAFGWGLSLMIVITMIGAISGGHVNPAVTVAMAAVKKCPWNAVLPYMLAQYLGGLVAAAVVYTVYCDAIYSFDQGFRQVPPSTNSTAQIFATYPQGFASIGSCFLDQVVGTAILLILVRAATDKENMNLPVYAQPPVIGIGLTAICMAFGHNCGAPLNPARDLSPRIFTVIAGWGLAPISIRNYMWFWIPVIGPHVGGLLGVYLYGFFIDMPSQNLVLWEGDIESLGGEGNRNEKLSVRSSLPSSPSSIKSGLSEEEVGRPLIEKDSTPGEILPEAKA